MKKKIRKDSCFKKTCVHYFQNKRLKSRKTSQLWQNLSYVFKLNALCEISMNAPFVYLLYHKTKIYSFLPVLQCISNVTYIKNVRKALLLHDFFIQSLFSSNNTANSYLKEEMHEKNKT